MIIEVKDLTKRFGDFPALDGVDLVIGEGELVALLGPSGSGKTTLLRVIAGLEIPDAGNVLFGGTVAAASPRERNVGFVFQHYALFRHMTVAKNIAFGLEIRPRPLRPSRAEIADRVERLLNLVQLEHFADRYPNQLSGGQRQRVALARALAIEPRVLLLDEPFGALDAKVRKELRRWLRRLHDEMRMTSLFVTHDQEEALELADRVVVMHRGQIEQIGTPAELYDRPASAFVLEFLSEVSRIDAVADDGRLHLPGLAEPFGVATGASGPVQVQIRPYDVEIGPAGLPGEVRSSRTLGPVTQLGVTLGGQLLDATGPAEELAELKPGARVGVRIKRAFIFPDGGRGVAVTPV